MTICVLTGCSSGLGWTVLSRLVSLVPARSTIYCGYRSPRPPPSPPPLGDTKLVWLPLDLGSIESVDSFVQEIQTRIRLGNEGNSQNSIDCVLLNAAIWSGGRQAQELLVNCSSQLRIVHQLVPLLSLPPRSRIIFTSSSLQNSVPSTVTSLDQVLRLLREPDHVRSTPRNRYACSKLLQSLAFHELRRTSPNTIDIVGVSPGFVPTTGLSRDSPWWQQWIMKNLIYYLPFCSTEEQGAQRILDCFNDVVSEDPASSSASSSSSTNFSSSWLSTGRDSPPTTSTTKGQSVVYHPPTLSPVETNSTNPLYKEVKRLLESTLEEEEEEEEEGRGERVGQTENLDNSTKRRRSEWEELMREIFLPFGPGEDPDLKTEGKGGK